MRWELHRVWVVEATLKPGQAPHLPAKRGFYLDEDSWVALASDQYDSARPALPVVVRGNVRVQLRRRQAIFDRDATTFYDFISGAYNFIGLFGQYGGIKYITEMQPETYWAPDALAGAGVR